MRLLWYGTVNIQLLDLTVVVFLREHQTETEEKELFLLSAVCTCLYEYVFKREKNKLKRTEGSKKTTEYY
jgi:hypothetical protein